MDNEKNDPIGKALGLSSIQTSFAVNNLIADAHNDSAKADFETARANVLNIIENGQEAIYKLGQIAESSQHPRAFEVLAKLMDTTLQANKDLMELQTKIRQISAVDAPTNEHAKTINNNLFVGSTAELQKVIENMKNGGSAV
jgi:transcriptional regulator with AAA-type ATPase domain